MGTGISYGAAPETALDQFPFVGQSGHAFMTLGAYLISKTTTRHRRCVVCAAPLSADADMEKLLDTLTIMYVTDYN